MTTLAATAADFTAQARRPVRMFGQSAARRRLGGRRVIPYSDAARRPIRLSAEGTAIFLRVADPADPLGKRKPIPWPTPVAAVSPAAAPCD